MNTKSRRVVSSLFVSNLLKWRSVMISSMLRPKLSLVVSSTKVSYHVFLTCECELDRRLRKEREKSLFDAAESNLVDGINEEGNFHIKEKEY